MRSCGPFPNVRNIAHLASAHPTSVERMGGGWQDYRSAFGIFKGQTFTFVTTDILREIRPFGKYTI